MPDARWRLLVHEVLAAISGSSELIVVVNETQALIDVVSSESYSGCVVSDDGRTGLIASHYINRATGMPDVHRQLFSVALNKHVLEATKRWDERRLESVGSSFTIYHWLQRRVLMNELANPKLTQLKAEVTKAQADAVAASQESEEVRKALLQKVDFAIANLMEEAARLTKG
ncbi:hypothetical protein PST407_03904 [Pseudomonas syringae pv. tomato]|nr:Uncharacterized protein ALO36_01115 [Pseudomonas syringae pv. tomato]RMP36344.1 hypothetical protein ALQ24_00218 [Pseudomonas syringae pv. antirrhini]KUR45341.1 hypothetical protein PST407_03904 [Pseudomonas syringae pv. tomato]KUR48159.1 hypothetical protein PSTA9_01308 [Pseudomonas syringae pv. tomato]RMQ71551.1 hypothetical protein ALQ00_02374 [Pseudomonas syringae pv. tomato]